MVERVIFLDIDGVLNNWDLFRSINGKLKDSDGRIRRVTKTELDLAKKIHEVGASKHNIMDMTIRSIRQIDKNNVVNLNAIVEASKAKIVVSSTWRISHSVKEIQMILSHHGFTKPESIIDITPSNLPAPTGFMRSLRGHEIQSWLYDHAGFEKFVILDDDCDMAHLDSYLVRTNMETGLTKDHVGAALTIMGVV